MKKLLSFFFLIIFVTAGSAWARPDGPPSYCVDEVERVKGVKVVFDCVIERPVSYATVLAYSHKVLSAHSGGEYEDVYINWYLPHYEKGRGVWATAHFHGKDNPKIEILALQDDNAPAGQGAAAK